MERLLSYSVIMFPKRLDKFSEDDSTEFFCFLFKVT